MPIPYPPQLKAVGGARTGIAPANLLDVLDVNGNLYYWADRPMNAPVAITGAVEGYSNPPIPVPPPSDTYAVSKAQGATPYTISSAAVASATIPSGAPYTSGTISIVVNPGLFQEADAKITWSGFNMPDLPSGAVVTGVYPVASIEIALEAVGDSDCFIEIGGITVPEGFGGGTLIGDNILSGSLAETLSAYSPHVELAHSGGLDPVSTNTVTVTELQLLVTFTITPTGEPGWGFPGEAPYGSGPYIPWLVQVPAFTFHRSLVTDVGSFVVQNLSGDTLSRDFEKIARRSALEGAMFVYRCYQADAEWPWLEVHGTLSVASIGTDTVQLKASQLINASNLDTPLELYCETCQLQWAGRRCGSGEATECSYSYQTCQVIERPFIVQNNYEKNLSESAASTVLNTINRRRRI